MLAVVLAVSLVGVHYENPNGLFTVELPREWTLADNQNDPAGVIVQRMTDGRLTICSIRAVPIGSITLQDFVLAIAAASQGERGYTSLAAGPTTLSGYLGHRRRFTLWIDEKGEFTKTVEERVVVLDHVGYVVHIEGFTPWFKKRSGDVAMLFDTFTIPGSKTAKRGQRCPLD